MKSTIETLKNKFSIALAEAFGAEKSSLDPMIVNATNPKFGDYQSNIAMSLGKELKQSPRAIAEAIVKVLDVSDICEPPAIAGPGFINLKLKTNYLETLLKQIQTDPRLGIPTPDPTQKIVIDFSSPNIAKEMHVGHLRSTIIGDCIARILEFLGHDVLRLNHVGDWGTQFGMLITYLREAYPLALTQPDALELGDLVAFYREAKIRFDNDPQFQDQARKEVVKLQAQDSESQLAWQLLCEQSRREFEIIYQRLDIKIIERGESFYNPFLKEIVDHLNQIGLLQSNQGAQCVFLEGFTNREGDPLPLIVQKSDGGYNYATTDLAAIRYRITQDHANRIIYVTDSGQSDHFAQIFQVAKKANWITNKIEVVHVPFGLVLGEDGKKLKTRSGDTVKLKDLLDEAELEAKTDLENRLKDEGRTESIEFIDQVSKAVGVGAIKYADLSQNRINNYLFSFKKMLARDGNTAPYLLYAYVRVQGISRKGGINFNEIAQTAKIILKEETELVLAKHILQFDEAINAVATDLLPNRLCQYLYELSQKYNQFYDRCPVLNSDEPNRTSRLILSDLTARTLKLGLSLLGIPILERM